MPQPEPAPAETRPRSSTPTQTLALGAALLATLAALSLAARVVLGNEVVAPTAALPWLLLAGVACGGAAIGWLLWRQHDLSRALHSARAEASGLRELIDGWQWRSDATHRLTEMRPPASPPDRESLAAGARDHALWDHFGADPALRAELRMRVESGSRLDGLCGMQLLASGRQRPVQLRGVALTDALGRKAGYIGTAIPVDDRTQRDIDLLLLRALLQTLPMPVFVLDGNAAGPQRVQRGNPAAAQWLGLDPTRLAGLPLAELQSRLPPPLRTPVSHALAHGDDAAPRPPGAGWDVRARALGALSGTERWGAHADLHWVLVLVPTPPEPPAAEPARAEHESFGYTVSHDLRAPIRVVEGFTKILKEDYGRQLDRIGNDHLDRVLGAAARMNSMIDALLALSQLSSRPLSKQPVNLSQLAGFVVEDLRRQSPDRHVAVHIEAGLQTQGDPTLLRMVLENLLGNAWKYSAKKSQAQIWLERGQDDGRTVFTVRDNGAGFDMRFADRLFGVFQRLHSASDFPGTGVGLASVQRIVNRHGGEIWAESAIDRGSSFHFTLAAPTPGH